MATTAMDYEANGGYDEEAPRYDLDRRSASPRRDDNDNGNRRSGSPAANNDSASKEGRGSKDVDDGAINPGSNLFVTGIHPKLTEQEVTRLFEKYGEVDKCQIMRDPHTKESRGFGFVKMATPEQADAAKEGLQGEQFEGRTLSIEKARRARPRTPTPGKYFGPPKRDPRGGRFNDRYDDRRRGGYGSYGRDDPYRYRGQDRRNDDRGYDRGYREDRGGYDRGYDRGQDRAQERGYRDERTYDRRERDDGYGTGRVDRYGGRDDRERYGPRGGGADDRRAPGYDRERYERPSDRDGARPRDPPSGAAGYGDAAPRGDGRENF